jgi:hypothetical protein
LALIYNQIKGVLFPGWNFFIRPDTDRETGFFCARFIRASRTPSHPPMTKPNLRVLASVLASGALCLVAGYFLGKASSAISTSHADAARAEAHAPNAADSRVTVQRMEEKRATVPAELATETPDAGPQWPRLLEKVRTPQSEREMAAIVRELAMRDPAAALELVRTEQNLLLREKLLAAALQGWGAIAPDEATAWSMSLPPGERSSAVSAVLAAVADQPDLAVRLTAHCCAQDPAHARNYGHDLVAVLAEAGAFSAAAGFALANPELREELLGPAYYEWAQHQPEQALTAVNTIADRAAREAAFRGLIQGWSAGNPAAAAGYALHLSSGDERTHLFAEALPQWIKRDPVAAGTWLEQMAPARECDDGRMTLATSVDLLTKQPAVAARWAATIVDSELRATTLLAVTKEWLSHDPAGARQFVRTDPKLSPGERTALLTALDGSPAH